MSVIKGMTTKFNGLTKTRKVLVCSGAVVLVALTVVGAFYGVKYLKARKLAVK